MPIYINFNFVKFSDRNYSLSSWSKNLYIVLYIWIRYETHMRGCRGFHSSCLLLVKAQLLYSLETSFPPHDRPRRTDRKHERKIYIWIYSVYIYNRIHTHLYMKYNVYICVYNMRAHARKHAFVGSSPHACQTN